jgi:hypothetical protein
MSQSAIWDALLVAGDMLAERRLDDCDRALEVIDAMGAWDFDVRRKRIEDSTLSSVDAMLRQLYPANLITNAPASLAGLRIVSDPNAPPNRMYVMPGDGQLFVHPKTLAVLQSKLDTAPPASTRESLFAALLRGQT